ncbi:MAG: methyltransferase domain-containing protein [bacterium]
MKKNACILCGARRTELRFRSLRLDRNESQRSDGEESFGDSQPNLKTTERSESLLWEVVACSSCGFTWRKAPPSQEPHLAVVPAVREQSATSGLFPNHNASGICSSTTAMLDEMDEISRFVKPPGTFLNIGEDYGGIAETAELCGWTAHSLLALDGEPHSGMLLDSRGMALTEDLWKVLDSAATFSTDDAQVIRLEGALERIRDLFRFLQSIRLMLHERGLLVISTVHYQQWNFALWGEGPCGCPADLPLWYFTPETLEILLRKCGFETLKVSSFSTPMLIPATGFFSENPDPDLQAECPPPDATLSGDYVPLPAYSIFQEVPRFRIIAAQEKDQRKQWFSESEALNLQTEESLDLTT